MMDAPVARPLFEAHGYPVLQNRVYETADEARACATGDIVLIQDGVTGLIRNRAFDPDLIRYDGAYQNEQAGSAAFREHLAEVAGLVERHLGRENVVEVGCGKGFFLELLASRGVDLVGFDPAYEGANPRISKRMFDPEARTNGAGLVLRHVLEHIPRPFDFLSALRDANGGRGRIYIEVPCFDWITQNDAVFDIFYEHVNYFRAVDFSRMFGTVVDASRLFGGQYLYVVADLASLREPQGDVSGVVAMPRDFGGRLARIGPRLTRPTVVWGAASKGVIFSLMRERAGHPVDHVIDVNPAKQGRHLAVTGLRVNSPAELLPHLPEGATIVVMNSNYTREIREAAGDAFHYVEVDHD